MTLAIHWPAVEAHFESTRRAYIGRSLLNLNVIQQTALLGWENLALSSPSVNSSPGAGVAWLLL